MDRGAWWAPGHRVAESRTGRLSAQAGWILQDPPEEVLSQERAS